MDLQGKKVGVLLESDFYEEEIYYYKHRFPEEGIELHFLTRLWGQPYLTFKGHEYHNPFEVHESFEDIDDATLSTFSAIIVPSAIVADRLRFTEDINKLAPAVEFLKRAFAQPNIIKGIICHGMWLVSPAPELVRGRNVVGHINLYGDIKNMGANYIDEDVVVDGDLVTGRTGGHCHLFARKIIDMMYDKEGVAR
ncbi:MAG: thiamine biosynthesis protein ThiJ [Chloroflexi bacterium]|nr:thiamine biosynthesis protein ThiJ [Chloroflexota bacterium]